MSRGDYERLGVLLREREIEIQQLRAQLTKAVAELERELAETQAKLTGLRATLQRAGELRLTCTPAERAMLDAMADVVRL